MFTGVTHVTVLVEDTDEAIAFYTERFGMELRADEEFGPGARWVTVAPPDGETEIVLQEPNPAMHGEERAAAMREQIGGGTVTVLGTEDCEASAADLEERGVTIHTPPEEVPWGVHTIVEDLYGNPYDVVEGR